MTPRQPRDRGPGGAPPSPFHPGEREVQRLAGVRAEAETRGQRMLTADVNAQQVAFFSRLPFLLSAHLDSAGQPWAGLVTGEPGFVDIDAATRRCSLDWRRAASPTQLQAGAGDAIGLLGIDLATRRRNRLNGQLLVAGAQCWDIAIEQGYGNCPQYISERAWPAQRFAGPYSLHERDGLDAAARALLARSDTAFIASASGPADEQDPSLPGAWGVDVSHRGGDPGFLRTQGTTLSFEDFPGNNLFNTLGNLHRYPPCSLLALDFASGEVLQLGARGSVEQTASGRRVRLDVHTTRWWRRQGD
ncbi:MAG: flavin-nucleotide-binding protein [Halioglobus sp.]|nr:flavin-nucleotide-binding protein [Halioglobus sp.]